jgi:hypothetical protein
VLWLSSDESVFLTDEIVNTDGGGILPNALR